MYKRWLFGAIVIIISLGASCLSARAQVDDTYSIEKQGVYRIPVPSTSLVIEFPADGFTVKIADRSLPYYYLTNKTNLMCVSFNFERAEKCNSSQTCRDYFATERLGLGLDPNKKNWRMSQVGDVFVSEYMLGPVSGKDLQQQNMNAHYVMQGVWIDVHLI